MWQTSSSSQRCSQPGSVDALYASSFSSYLLRTAPCQPLSFHGPPSIKLLRTKKAGDGGLKKQQITLTPSCLFGGLFGRKQTDSNIPFSTDPTHGYHLDVPLPIPESFLANTFLAGRELKCCYKASRDGFGAAKFHEKCDFKGPCIIVGETDKGIRFGAFNPEGYRSTDDYYDTFEAFLFYWPDDDSSASDPMVLKKLGGSGAALFDYARGGPQFGADGLLIGAPLAPVMGGFAGPDTNSGVGDLRRGKSRLGLSYAKRADGKDSIFGDDRYADIQEIEVFCSPDIAKLY